MVFIRSYYLTISNTIIPPHGVLILGNECNNPADSNYVDYTSTHITIEKSVILKQIQYRIDYNLN